MIEISARKVLIDPEIYERSNCRERLDRVLPFIQCDDVDELKPGDMENVLKIGKRRHGKDDFGDAEVLVFTTFGENRRHWHYRASKGCFVDGLPSR